MSSSTIEYKLDSVSVVLLAQTHNPTIVNPDFLKKNDIVKHEWEIDSNPPQLSSPGLSLVTFKNSVRWEVVPDRCTVIEKVESQFKESYFVHECAKKYIEALPHVHYTVVGMNWIFSLNSGNEELQKWLKDRFLKSGEWQNSMEWTNFTFRVLSHLPPCNFIMNLQNKIIACNFHADISSESDKVEKMHSILDNYKANQDFLKKSLSEYFLEDL